MAYANANNSPRLQAALKVLRMYQPGGLTGLDLCRAAGIMNPGEVCSELRRQGYEIECKEEPKSATGRRVFRYRLTAEPEPTQENV